MTCSFDGVTSSDFSCTELTCDDIDDCGEHASCDEGNSGDGFMCLCDVGYTGTAYNEEATCVEKICNAFTFEEGMIVSTSTSYCTEGTVLSTISDTSCNLEGCSEGYKSSGTATVSCPIGGDSLEYDFTCT